MAIIHLKPNIIMNLNISRLGSIGGWGRILTTVGCLPTLVPSVLVLVGKNRIGIGSDFSKLESFKS